jgi:hypothetical protein
MTVRYMRIINVESVTTVRLNTYCRLDTRRRTTSGFKVVSGIKTCSLIHSKMNGRSYCNSALHIQNPLRVGQCGAQIVCVAGSV